ncbi:hypothetical protein K501DRAFT_271620 [Backusella circina FSU 941]|nr:hypothetical protein K501DRAFT_271620 [Backusella circina FSU 941]
MARPIHPVYAEFADAYNEKSPFMAQAFQGIKANNFEKLYLVRKGADDFFFGQLELPDVIRYQKQIPGPNDSIVNLTIFRPPATEDEVLPIIIHSHGGGFVLESVQTYAKAAIDFYLI